MSIIRKVFIYTIGLFCLALGVTISIKSDLGVSAVNSIPYTLSIITGMDQGHITIGIFSLFILLQIILLRRDFKVVNLLQILFTTIFGYFITATNFLFDFIAVPSNYFLQLLYLLISIVFIAVGVILYLRVDLIPMPAEGAMLAIQQKSDGEFHKIKSAFDTTVVIIAALLALLFLGKVAGVREGTLISAILVGRCIGFLNKLFHSHLKALDAYLA